MLRKIKNNFNQKRWRHLIHLTSPPSLFSLFLHLIHCVHASLYQDTNRIIPLVPFGRNSMYVNCSTTLHVKEILLDQRSNEWVASEASNSRVRPWSLLTGRIRANEWAASEASSSRVSPWGSCRFVQLDAVFLEQVGFFFNRFGWNLGCGDIF